MKSALFSLLIFCPLCVSFGQTQHAAPAQIQQDSAFIDGQIILSGEKPTSIRFAVVDYLLGIEKYEYAAIDDEGKFQIKFFIRNTHQVYCSYGKKAKYNTLILSPGDSLTLVVKDDDGVHF